MKFKTDSLIQDQTGESRWRVLQHYYDLPYLRHWIVVDQKPGMERKMLMMMLDYRSIKGVDQDFSIQQLRDAFYRMITTLSGGSYNMLPEPIDLLTLTNQQDPMDSSLRQEEPALILSVLMGSSLKPVRDIQAGNINLFKLKSHIITTLKSLKSLHKNQCVIRELPLDKIQFNHTNQRLYYSGLHSLILMQDFNGYNPKHAAFGPDPVFSAPEAFQSTGQLTPATDIYAIGKLGLQLVLGNEYRKFFTADDPFPSDVQNLINSLNLPTPWPRFLSMCLQQDPKQRFQTATEAEIFFLPSEKQKTIKEQNKYRENTQLPDAMLLIWNDNLTTRDRIFSYRALYADLSLNHNLKPRLFFQTYFGNINDNKFFSMLQDQFSLEIITLKKKSSAIGILNHKLDPYLSSIRHLILVGNPDEPGVQSMLQHPNASKWRIHWVRGAGNWNPSIAVDRVTDAAKYIRAKN